MSSSSSPGQPKVHTLPAASDLHPAWRDFMTFCRQLQFGEIDRLVIQDGLPVLAETTRQKVKFNSPTK